MQKNDNNGHAESAKIHLPWLAVKEAQHTGQETIDKAIDALEKARPDLIEGLLNRFASLIEYDRYLREVILFFRSHDASTAEASLSRLAMLDMLFELHRRVQKALGNEDPEVKGVPVVKDRSRPLPPIGELLVLQAQDRSELYGERFVSQELVNRVTDALRARRPELIYEFGEALRREMGGAEIYVEFTKFLQSISDEIPTSEPQWLDLSFEIRRRIRAMCEISTVKKL